MHINHPKILLRISIFKNYGSLSMCEKGKEMCTNQGSLILTALIQLDETNDIQLKIALTRFLMACSILKRGKVEIFENRGLDIFLRLMRKHLSLEEPEVIQLVLNLLQIISQTALEVRARKFMLEEMNIKEVKILTDKSHVGNELILEQAKICENIIEWKP